MSDKVLLSRTDLLPGGDIFIVQVVFIEFWYDCASHKCVASLNRKSRSKCLFVSRNRLEDMPVDEIYLPTRFRARGRLPTACEILEAVSWSSSELHLFSLSCKRLRRKFSPSCNEKGSTSIRAWI